MPGHRSIGAIKDEERDALLDLWVASWRATFPTIDFEARRQWFRAHLVECEAQGAILIGAFEDALKPGERKLIGFVLIDPKTGWLDQISVKPNSFGAGVGRELLNAAKRASPSTIRLDVNADNFRALRFYRREGFSRVGAGVNKLSGRETAVLEWRGEE
ncbi:MAG: GNAT family N-acetyltransferase [Rhodoblastus sp.]